MSLGPSDRFGIFLPREPSELLPSLVVEDLLLAAGLAVFVAEEALVEALGEPESTRLSALLVPWISAHRLEALIFGWMKEADGVIRFARLATHLEERGLAGPQGLLKIYFAGPGEARRSVEKDFPFVAGTFGAEAGTSTILRLFNLSLDLLPPPTRSEIAYDEARLLSGRNLVSQAVSETEALPWRVMDSEFPRGGLAYRIAQGPRRGHGPLLSLHFLRPRQKEGGFEALADLAETLAKGGYLDIFSFDPGTPGEGSGASSGMSAGELERLKESSRPQLLRCHPGVGDAELQRRLERSLAPVWHSLSFWLPGSFDGGGPGSILSGLREQFEALSAVAALARPLELDLAESLAFLGADDVSLVVASYLAAKAAKRSGIQSLILQVPLGPVSLRRGVKDLARAKALLHIVRELEEGSFRIHPLFCLLRPFNEETESAEEEARFVAEVALMDDIEPWDEQSPEMVDFVGHKDGVNLGAAAVEARIHLLRAALNEHRTLRRRGLMADPSPPVVLLRTSEILAEARATVAAIEASLRFPYEPEGFHDILRRGFLVVPGLGEAPGKGGAKRWATRLVEGALVVVDEEGKPLAARDRLATILGAGGAPGEGREESRS